MELENQYLDQPIRRSENQFSKAPSTSTTTTTTTTTTSSSRSSYYGRLCNNRSESFRTVEMGVAKSDSAEVRLSWLRSQIIGGNEVEYESPFGKRTLVYADHTASGRSLLYIENFIINNVLPFYGMLCKHFNNINQ
ncbi:hypothetical protein PanWU01x14_064960 [Parasponia andersonii]|uniref:Uncharacterized protein n=1 Tax=Parasponia andersonii TaxID=3476 RepID=A0A2P5DGP0_PARAD|nr:hypothetical protein PanWU01x14_064960 [Parasponia andersonii]